MLLEIVLNAIFKDLTTFIDFPQTNVLNVNKQDVKHTIQIVNAYNVLMDLDMLIIYVMHVKIYIVLNSKQTSKAVKNVAIFMVYFHQLVFHVKNQTV